MTFYQLHHQQEPLLLCNVWDINSAIIAEKSGFCAIGTSSAAIAHSMGRQDGENIPFSSLLSVVKNITANTALPLTVDIESGYSTDPYQVASHIKVLANCGVVGINIEDSLCQPLRQLQDADVFAEHLKIITTQLKKDGIDVFVNVRTDVFLLNHSNQVPETQKRMTLYQAAGADGIFVPGLRAELDIIEVVQCTELPINVMLVPELPNFNKLKELGIKRISMGNAAYDAMNKKLESIFVEVNKQQSFSSLIS